MVHDLDLGHLVRRRQQIIHEALRDELALRIVGELLEQRGADAVGDAAHGHAAHDLWVDDGAAIVPDDVAPDLGLAEVGIDGHQQQVKLEREAGIDLQLSARRHLDHMAEGEVRLHARRQAMEVAMRDGDELHEAAFRLRRRAIEDIAVLVDRAVLRYAEIMGADGDEPRLELLRGMEGGAAQHDRHAAAHRALARQRRQRIRPHHPDAVRVDAEHLADHGADQGLVPLPGGNGVDVGGHRAAHVDGDAA